MTRVTPAPAVVAPSGTVSPVRMTWLHLKFQFLETVRIPIAVLGNMFFPALAMFFFVVPQSDVAQNPVFATMAVAGLALFAVCSASLFTYGLGVAEDRQLPFDPFVRSLPAGPGPRMVARILNGAVFALFGLVPLILIGAFFTAASVTLLELLAGVATILATAVPFVLLGMAVGYSLTAKAALPVVQVVLFPLAFAGGLFLPPVAFPDWLNTLSQGTPTRAGRDLLVQALTGADAYAGAWPVLLGWTVLFATLAVVAYRRDEGRRFR
ncbi:MULTISPECIES: ABC transporter permease [unclassified Isoptericola]|uniref:ABC transporter permease n=1 Tax=unclassified Isoptericola TaxID=2623355 RepID=UPI00271352B2|nr:MULTISPECIES: ABC transporter permease [unclassified Isoptericola]MDO8145761.1 ABC transporter permease [Isoptericola sp. 178]MDO8147898.1 ABC transporter permease [Isoptericola sp. b515]